MRNLSAVTKRILDKVEHQTGKNIQFFRDESLSVLATIHMARNGAAFHVLRYRPSNEPIDYLIAYQAGFLLRLFDNEPAQRFDFSPHPGASKHVELLLTAGQALNSQGRQALFEVTKFVTHWALLNLRSLAIGMRIDRWIATSYPELRELQQSGLADQQQQNMDVLAYKLGNLTVPTTLLGINAAYALFVDRLGGTESYAVPYEVNGLLTHGRELLRIWDEIPSDATHDCKLVDSWAAASGMTNWYNWIPYEP